MKIQLQPQSFLLTTRAALFNLKHLIAFAIPCSYSIERNSRLSEYSLKFITGI
jgi:hypothetical protein